MWSLHKHYFEGTMNVVEFIKYASTLGIEGVELLDTFWQGTDSEVHEALDILSETGLKVACYALGNNFVHPEIEKREEQIQIVKDGVDMANKLDTQVVRIYSGDMGDYNVTFDEARNWIVQSLRECANYAKSRGIILGLENHGIFAGKISQIKSVIEEVGSSNLRSTFDTGNWSLVHESPADAIDCLSHLTAHVHIKDFQFTETQTEKAAKSIKGHSIIGTIVGKGQVDTEYILKVLKSAKYDGWLCLEYVGQENEKVSCEESIQYIKKVLQKT